MVSDEDKHPTWPTPKGLGCADCCFMVWTAASKQDGRTYVGMQTSRPDRQLDALRDLVHLLRKGFAAGEFRKQLKKRSTAGFIWDVPFISDDKSECCTMAETMTHALGDTAMPGSFTRT